MPESKYSFKYKRNSIELAKKIGYKNAREKLNLSKTSMYRWRRELEIKDLKHIDPKLIILEKYDEMSDAELRAVLKLKYKMRKEARDLINGT